MSNSTPEWRRSLGLVSVAVFAHQNSNDDGTTSNIRTISCQRRYFDRNEKSWKSSTYLGPAELGAAISLLRAAEQYVMDAERPASDEF